MKFSVIIPLYNKADYVTDTVQSVLTQTFTDFEVIIIDDGSTDGSAERVSAIADPRIRLIHQSNAGVSAARNRGIALAQGEWVAFLDADDLHHPQYLETMHALQQAFPEVDMTSALHVTVSNNARQWPPAWPMLSRVPEVEYITDLHARWMKGPTLCTGAVCVRTALLHRMSPCFAVGESQGEDLDLFFRLAEHTPIPMALEPLTAYRTDVRGSLTSHFVALRLEPYLQRMKVRAISGEIKPSLRKSALRLVAQQQVTLARQSLESNKRLDGFRWLLRGHDAIQSKRWWMTLVMMVLPSHFQSWRLWRARKSTRGALAWKEEA